MSAEQSPSTTKPEPSTRRGLCLTGGGVTGAMFQVGCIAALEDRIEGFKISDFDVFVGAQSGATLATFLAGGLPIQRIYRALLDPADDLFPLARNHLLRFDMQEILRVFGTTIAAARQVISSAAGSPLDINLWAELDRFVDTLPAGLFTLDPYERFVSEVMTRRGVPLTFPEMQKQLLIVANDLDAGARAVFGAGDLMNVPVSQAIAAASAIPILYAPVTVDGRDYVEGGIGDVAHADLAEQAGCRLVVVINPLVPVRATPESGAVPTGHGRKNRIREKGVLWVYNQAMRMRMEARMKLGFERFRAEHPDTTIALIEPDPTNANLFMHSPMNFAARRAILEEGYNSTRRSLADPESSLRQTLERAGYTVVSA